MSPELYGITLLIFMIAFLYASVGHGGASGYLAVLSFFAFPPAEMASTALILNICVASIALYAYWRGRYFSWKLTWPLVIMSIPAAFLGGYLDVSAKTYSILLAVALAFAAIRLSLVNGSPGLTSVVTPVDDGADQSVPMAASVSVGGIIGFLSGIVGIGGGVFLSPIMLLLRWADVKRTAATSAFFIVVNATAGLLGRHARHDIVAPHLLPFLLAAVLGGALGAHFGATTFSGPMLRRILALVLLIAAVKLLVIYY